MGRLLKSGWWSLPWLQAKLAYFQRENKQLKKKNDSLWQEIKRLSAHLSSSSAAYNEIEEAHAKLVGEHSALSKSWEIVKMDHSAIATRHASVIEERDALLRDANILRETLSEEQNKNSDLRSAAFKLQTDLDMRVNAIVILEDQIQFLSKVNALNHAAVKAAIATTAGTDNAKSSGDAESGSQDGRFYSQQ